MNNEEVIENLEKAAEIFQVMDVTSEINDWADMVEAVNKAIEIAKKESCL